MVGKNILLAGCLVGALVLSSFSASARESNRDGEWEGGFMLLGSGSATFDGQGGSSVDVDTDVGWGFTFGYNLNSHIALGFEFTSTSPDYKATAWQEPDDGSGIPEMIEVSHEMDLYQTQFNGIYNISDGRFTPYLQVGFGWSFIDSNVADGPPQGYCWWDPWWGYICDGYQSTYDTTNFSYNAAAGIRFEINNSTYFKLSYQEVWVDLDNASNASLPMYRLEVGSTF
ncbi:MAG: porin family protein [Gammaproteobacteria bacterium]|nr:MAG: porin family protein [Gammaproteobacteria bacterium]